MSNNPRGRNKKAPFLVKILWFEFFHKTLKNRDLSWIGVYWKVTWIFFFWRDRADAIVLTLMPYHVMLETKVALDSDIIIYSHRLFVIWCVVKKMVLNQSSIKNGINCSKFQSQAWMMKRLFYQLMIDLHEHIGQLIDGHKKRKFCLKIYIPGI